MCFHRILQAAKSGLPSCDRCQGRFNWISINISHVLFATSCAPSRQWKTESDALFSGTLILFDSALCSGQNCKYWIVIISIVHSQQICPAIWKKRWVYMRQTRAHVIAAQISTLRQCTRHPNGSNCPPALIAQACHVELEQRRSCGNCTMHFTSTGAQGRL